MSTTYLVNNIRVIFPSGKVAEKNPDRFATVYGEFHSVSEDAKGKRSAGEKLSIASKVITNDMAQSPEFTLDMDNGYLTLPSGERGRPKSSGATADDIAARLAALRNPKA